MTSPPTPPAASSTALRLLRYIAYEASHISDLTFELDRLYGLKPGGIDEIRQSLARLRQYLGTLDSPEVDRELDYYRGSEERPRR